MSLPLSLSWDNGTSFTSTKSNTITTTETVHTYGGATDTWGRSWSTSELADGTFQVKIDPPTSVFTVSYDQVRAKVYYTSGVSSTSTVINNVHPDHLGSTNVVTDQNANLVQTLDYYPYGATRINNSTGANQLRKYIGQFFDNQTNLAYLNARFYEVNRGQFLSQDPVFWELGYKLRGANLSAFLTNPQVLNSYSYAENNPIIKKDPDGRCAGPLFVVCLGVIGANMGVWTNYAGNVLEKQAQGNPNPREFTMSYGEIGTSAAFGAFELAFLAEKRAVSGAYAFGTSIAEDRAAGNSVSIGKATVSGMTALVAGSLFQGLVGKVAQTLEMHNRVTNQVFQNASTILANNAFGTNNSQSTGGSSWQSAQNAAKTLGIGNTGSGSFVGVYNFGPGAGIFNFGTGSWVTTGSQTSTQTK